MNKFEKIHQQALKNFWRSPWYILAFGFGAGFGKPAPGTYGTMIAIPIYCLVAQTHALIYLIGLGLAFGLGVYICQKVTDDLGVEDYPGIVWDEIVGYLVTMFGLPFKFSWIILGFVLFRLLDILKPPPIGWVDRHVHGGWGVMLDDLLAGIFACAILQALKWGISG